MTDISSSTLRTRIKKKSAATSKIAAEYHSALCKEADLKKYLLGRPLHVRKRIDRQLYSCPYSKSCITEYSKKREQFKDSDGYIYVADTLNNRIVMIDRSLESVAAVFTGWSYKGESGAFTSVKGLFIILFELLPI